MTNTLIDTLKFVYSAISNKSPIIDNAHFVIENGYARASNGVLSVGSPIETDLNCAPHADTLMKAISSCKSSISFSHLDTGKLQVKSGRFKALVSCLNSDDFVYHAKPSGAEVEVDGDVVLGALKKLEPFVASSSLRPWTNGVLLRGQSAFATNNICLVEYWLGVDLPFTANIPLQSIKVLIKQPKPKHIIMDHASITFLYESGSWIKTLLYDQEWPAVEGILATVGEQTPVPEELFHALKTVAKFTEDKVYFRGGKVCSSGSEYEGAEFEVDGLGAKGIYSYDAIKLLEGVAKTIDFTLYPNPVIFYGDNIRGALLGVKE